MSKFTFKVGEKTATGETTKISGIASSRFESTGKCPYCNKKFKAGNNPGQFKSAGEVESTLRFSIRRHYNSEHK